jgi:vacuolar-type H+-ATPase subunit H
MKVEILNEKQELAIELALSGLSDGEIASKIKVSRQMVNTWRNHDSLFIETLEIRRRNLREKHQDSLNALMEKAIEVLKNGLDDEDPKIRLQAAKQVLSMSGLKTAMKGEKQQTKDEIIEEFLTDCFEYKYQEFFSKAPGSGRNNVP